MFSPACCMRRARRIGILRRRDERSWESAKAWFVSRSALKVSTTLSPTSNKRYDQSPRKTVGRDSRTRRPRLSVRVLRVVAWSIHRRRKGRARDVSDLECARGGCEAQSFSDHAGRVDEGRTICAQPRSRGRRVLSFASRFAGRALEIRSRARLAHLFVHYRLDQRGPVKRSFFVGAGDGSFAF